MKKVFLLALVFITTIHFMAAQTGDLWVKSGDKGLYLVHKVAAKENFYSIGRLYNLPPKEIEAYNKLDMNKGLNMGQVIRIPLTAANFSQTVNKGTPVFYQADEKEALAKISNLHYNVSPESLRRWNDLKSDQVSAGNKIIIGFLISKGMPVVTISEKKPPIVKTENSEKNEKNEKAETLPVVINTEHAKEQKPVKTEPVVEKPAPVIIVPEIKPADTEQGYFKMFFDQQIKVSPPLKDETVTAGIFKTASGWRDAKYYLLIDKVQPGTIVKVINPDNNKAVYAKVLGEMNGIRQNEGLNIRISNSAASALQITDQDKFIVKVRY